MKVLIATALLLATMPCVAQQPSLAPDAPEDKPVSVQKREMEAFNTAIAPYVAEAKATYSIAKAKFIAGLPEGQSFFVTTRLHGDGGTVEQVFIAVRSIDGDKISGRIWSDIRLVPSYKHGDAYSLSEEEILDWLITHPDGSEEGNYVGRFLDGYSDAR